MPLPRFDHLPEPPLGRLNLLQHGDGRTVAVFDPRTGDAEEKYELADPEPGRDARVRGRYAPLRSGTLALYRDGAGRVVVQRGRRQIVVPDEATVSVGALGPLVTLTVEQRHSRERLRVLGGAAGPLLRDWI